MEQANKFFFLSYVNENVNCDFKRVGAAMVLTFSHADDKTNNQKLEFVITSQQHIDGATLKVSKTHNVNYNLIDGENIISKGHQNFNISSAVWIVVVATVNKIFAE